MVFVLTNVKKIFIESAGPKRAEHDFRSYLSYFPLNQRFTFYDFQTGRLSCLYGQPTCQTKKCLKIINQIYLIMSRLYRKNTKMAVFV